jgi:hypothetical protein
MNIPRPWEIAMQSHIEVLRFASSPEGRSYMKFWLDDRQGKYGNRAASPSAAALMHAVKDLMMSDPIYISDEMQELTYMAMEDFDRRQPISEEDFFLTSGFVYLAEPFVTLDVNSKKIAHRAYSWMVEDMTFSEVKTEDEYDRYLRAQSGGEEFLIESVVEKGLRVILWSHMDDVDEIGWANHASDLLAGSKWAISHCTTMPLKQINNVIETMGEGDPRAHWLTFLRVMNRLMQERITLSTRYKAHRSTRKQAARAKLKIEDVIVVELRRRSQKSEKEGGSQRIYTHRWVVKGFWRNQYYPTLRSHRPKYIGGHVRGPKDKPLIVKKRVWNWDR